MNKAILWIAVLVLFGLSGCSTKQTGSAPEPKGKTVSAYYYAPYSDSTSVQTKLEAAGFEIVGVYAPTQMSETIIITTEALKRRSAMPGRGFAAVLRVLIDKAHNRVAVTNPVYFGKAFLQDSYSHALALRLTEALESALGTLTPSLDAYAYDTLDSYHFMVSLPRYSDVYHLAEGDEAWLETALENYQNGKYVVFRLVIGEGRTLFGVDLSSKTKAFLTELGTQNAEILPYTIMIEEGRATALAAKYYIAISYPLLTMDEFMRIASVPGAIEKELKRPFE